MRALWSRVACGRPVLPTVRCGARRRARSARGAEARLDPVRRPRGVHRVLGRRGSRGRPGRSERLPRGRPGADRGLRRSGGEVHRGRGDGRVRGSGSAQRRRGASRARGPAGARGGRGVARAGLCARGACGGEHGRGDRQREQARCRRGARDRGRGEHGVPAAVRCARRQPGRRRRDPAGDAKRNRLRGASSVGREGQGEPGRDVARDARDLGAGRTARAAGPVRRADARARPDPLRVASGDARLEAAPDHRRRDDRHREVAALPRDRGGGRRRWRPPGPRALPAVRGADRLPRCDADRATGVRDLRLGPTGGRTRQARRGRRPARPALRRARTRRATSGCSSGSGPASRV